MRTAFLALFFATAAAPATATSDPNGDGQNWRNASRANSAERAQARAERRTDSEAQAEPQAQARPRQGWRGPASPLVQPDALLERRRARRGDPTTEQGPDAPAAGQLLPRRGEQSDNLDSIRNWRREERQQLRDVQVRTRPGSRPSAVITPPPGARPDVQAPAPVRVSRHRDDGRDWHRRWRDDRRYDWRRYRERNRWLFNLGYYYDPFGWSYRRYPIGWRLWPSYYDVDHWLHDPWRYRLPPSYGRYRWVRYWDDALLVDIYSGRVVDVIYDFFW